MDLNKTLSITPPISEHSDTSKRRAITFIDLFAGIGGMRLGFETLPAECIFTSEWNEYSKKTYIENFGLAHPIVGDIRTDEAKEKIVSHDLLLPRSQGCTLG